jgi:endonuclease G, mitochondrial
VSNRYNEYCLVVHMSESESLALTNSVMARLSQARGQIARSLEQITNGNPLGAETDPGRAVERLQAKASLSKTAATLMANAIRAAAEDITQAEAAKGERKAPSAEAVIGPTLDFVGVSFLTRGRIAADAVARIAHRDGRAKGSGFLIAPGILLTNNHVIQREGEATDLIAQFDYELDDQNKNRVFTEFELDPRLFVFDPIERLDYTLIALGPRRSGPRDPKTFGYLALSDASDKHMLGEVANVVQHPQGRFKEIVLRENRLVSRLDYVLHYLADTEPGSSGSPVFNNDWQVIALHHWGGPSPAVLDGLRPGATTEVNEGVRISSIVRDLASKRAGGSPHGETLARLLELWRAGARVGIVPEIRTLRDDTSTARPSPARTRTTMPREQEDFSDRAGYEPGFVPGFVVPMPELKHVEHQPARNLEARQGDDPHELPYHHFSIVMNADRRLAFFTACNIDGRLTRHVNRQTKDVDEHPTLKQLDIESLDRQEDAEATDAFSLDPRVWKVAVWAEDHALHSVALLADQRPVLEKLTRGVPEALDALPESIEMGPEQFDDLVELQRVQEFLASVEQIESLTGLRFPDVVRRGDIRAGQEALTVAEAEDSIARRLRGGASRRNGGPRPNGGKAIVVKTGAMPVAYAHKSGAAKTTRSAGRSRPVPRPAPDH